MSEDEDNQFEDENEDELEEEEEDEEEEEEQPKKEEKKKEDFSAKSFLDIEADVDEDGEPEEDEDEDQEADWIVHEKEIENAASQRQIRPRFFSNEKREEEIVQELLERHRNYDEDEDFDDEDDARGVGIRQQSLLPSVKDPKLWMVRCINGKEKLVALSMMRKFLQREGTPDKLLIKSVIAPSHLKGFIYVEAEKEAHVKQAIKGMRLLQEYNLKLVPISEMVDVLTVTKKPFLLRRNDWARVKRGLHKGDLAQVYDVDESRGKVTIKLIPRLDFTSLNKVDDPSKAGKRKFRDRPPARFFNPDEVSSLGGRESLDRRIDSNTGEPIYIFGGNKFREGFLLKPMDARSLDTADVSPTLEELQKFQEKPTDSSEQEGNDLAGITGNLRQIKKANLSKGDTVIVVEGDLKHLMGVVESVESNAVTIRPKHVELQDLLSFPPSQLRKYFKKGDHVKVISGKFEGETGFIIRVEENTIILFSDLTNQEITVLSQDIQECSEVATGRIKLGNYELHDLVTLNHNSVGVIVKVERDSFKILDNTGNVQTVKLAEVGQKKITPKFAAAFDSNHNQVVVGDISRVIEGQYKGRQGTIQHIYKSYAFLHSRDMLENSGIFVAKMSHLLAIGAKKQADNNQFSSGPKFPPMSPGAGLRGSPRNQGGPRGPSGPGGAGGPRRRDDPFKDKTVAITRGQWKGYIGVVRAYTETNYRIELHTNSKTVTIPRDSVRLRDDNTPSDMGASEMAYPPATPVWGTRTPMRDDPTLTPSRAPSTPSRAPGTPVHGTAWDPSMPNTPMRTATPSWEPEYSSSWVPSTPGTSYSNAYSPYTPSEEARSQYDGTPSDSITNPTTPSLYTPSGGYDRTPMDINTPYSSYSGYNPTTPGSVNPTTPKGPVTPGYPETPYQESTPATPSTVNSVWLQPKVVISVVGDSPYKSRVGVIQEAFNENGVSVCRVTLDEDEKEAQETVTIPSELIERVPPKNKTKVIILEEDVKGQTGQLVTIDGASGIVKLPNHDVRILPLQHLAIYRG